ncbi:hypothetical protein CMUS01_12037 [Colletotrichum musicola]|uniref:Uncharacterized protein n=1 Tax=Colletotrichum musicola TaxID=2175873 RepID=A0A8H6JS60_9PEZI|nr:hypothetical protein CMUS01_12037 [Colletotrichum musicola]
MPTEHNSSHHEPGAFPEPTKPSTVRRASAEQLLRPISPPGYYQNPSTAIHSSQGPDIDRASIRSLGTNVSSIEGATAPSKLSTSSNASWNKFRGFLSFEQPHWSLELSAIGLSISSLTAIIILLALYNDKPLVSWTWPISFNAVVSTLSATSRATLAFAISACISQGKWNWYRTRNDKIVVFDRFEEASRGPWGSLRLLWWTRLRPNPQTSIEGMKIAVKYDYGAVAAIWEGFSDLATVDILKPTQVWFSRYAELAVQATYRPNTTISFNDLRTLIVSYAIMQSDQRFRQGQQNWSESTVDAQECALYFCTNIYRSAVENGVLRETILGSYSNRNLDSYVYDSSSDPKDIEAYRAHNQEIGYTLYGGVIDNSRTDLQLTISEDEYFAATRIKNSEGLRFNVSHNATGSLVNCLLEEFWQPKDGTQLFYSQQQGKRPAIMSILGTSGNITRNFENVAASLTKWMRNRSMRDEPFSGAANEWVVRIRVNWEYLSLPVGALVIGCIFCVLSIVETRRLRLPAWRGSSLATLAYGLDPESRGMLRDGGQTTKLDGQARAVEVKFVDSEKGPQLVHEKQDVVEAGEGQDRLG